MSEEKSASRRPARAMPTVCDNDHELVLVKNDQRFVFRCAPGEERQLMGRLAEMVKDPQSGVEWFDAAVLSKQLGERMSHQLKPAGRRARDRI